MTIQDGWNHPHSKCVPLNQGSGQVGFLFLQNPYNLLNVGGRCHLSLWVYDCFQSKERTTEFVSRGQYTEVGFS